jgi:hypothetical protein
MILMLPRGIPIAPPRLCTNLRFWVRIISDFQNGTGSTFESDEETGVRSLDKAVTFKSRPDPIVKVVDILVNAFCRALNDTLQERGWAMLGRLMTTTRNNRSLSRSSVLTQPRRCLRGVGPTCGRLTRSSARRGPCSSGVVVGGGESLQAFEFLLRATEFTHGEGRRTQSTGDAASTGVSACDRKRRAPKIADLGAAASVLAILVKRAIEPRLASQAINYSGI